MELFNKNYLKFRNNFYLCRKKKEKKHIMPYYGRYYVKVLEDSFLNIKEVNELYKYLYKKYKKRRIFVFKDLNLTKNLTKKPINIRMGKGKGPFESKLLKIHSGRILFEFYIKRKRIKRQVKKIIYNKLSIKIKIKKIKI